jgi:hypothetical protein
VFDHGEGRFLRNDGHAAAHFRSQYWQLKCEEDRRDSVFVHLIHSKLTCETAVLIFLQTPEVADIGMQAIVYCGTLRSGMGVPANRRRQGLASQRAQRPDHDTRALSVAMPVSAYIWR